MAVSLQGEIGDITRVPSDVLLLKFARHFYGSDGAVAEALIRGGVCAEDDVRPEVWEPTFIETAGIIAPKRVLFLGTPGLRQLSYPQIHRFAAQAIRELADFPGQEAITTMTTTIHGAGYGLDIEESLNAQVAGFEEALSKTPGIGLKTIKFVEKNARRAEILTKALRVLPLKLQTRPARPPRTVATAEVALEKKKRIFVAMPFSEEFEDVYQFGIYAAVRKCGGVCEKVDETIFAGSIVDRIQDGIRNADLVIADLTGERPNVYLEVGFAWGLNRPVVLVARDGVKLHFDLSHHKCVFYKTIGKLAADLERVINELFTGKEG